MCFFHIVHVYSYYVFWFFFIFSIFIHIYSCLFIFAHFLIEKNHCQSRPLQIYTTFWCCWQWEISRIQLMEVPSTYHIFLAYFSGLWGYPILGSWRSPIDFRKIIPRGVAASFRWVKEWNYCLVVTGTWFFHWLIMVNNWNTNITGWWWLEPWNFEWLSIPIGSMYGIFTNIYPINDPNVGKYTIHGSYGIYCWE